MVRDTLLIWSNYTRRWHRGLNSGLTKGATMLDFITKVFLYSGMLGLILTFIFVGLVLSGWGIRGFSAAVVWVLGLICKLTGGKL